MSSQSHKAHIIFPHQLFLDHLKADKSTVMILVEDDLYFKQYPFHKQKLILHRASMQRFRSKLEDKGFKVEYVETSRSGKSMNQLKDVLKRVKLTELVYYELVDDWLQQGLDDVISSLEIKAYRIESPAFLTNRGLIDDYFENNPNRMQNFYVWQRKRLNILVKNNKPVGDKWSFDTANRERLPKNITLPPAYKFEPSNYVDDAKKWVEKEFKDNPGNASTFAYPITHDDAKKWLMQFTHDRLSTFGPYEDAIAQNESELFHSKLSALINIGLLTPQQVIDETLHYADKNDVPIESLEGFIRQVIGWREYMRATYIRFGRTMRTSNHFGFTHELKKPWWDGTTGIDPIDTVITRVLDTAYAHHIERLMILGNMMVLLRIKPDDVYEWFMGLFIDAYDWVMVPNVYAMSQYAAGDMITTKPYISGSNYVIKMSDFKKAEWSDVWDALYWKFIDDHRSTIEKNFRTKMVINLYDRFDKDKKTTITRTANKWL